MPRPGKKSGECLAFSSCRLIASPGTCFLPGLVPQGPAAGAASWAPPLSHCLSFVSDHVSWVKIKAGDAETGPGDGCLSLSGARRQEYPPPGHTEHGWARRGLREREMQVIPGSPEGEDCIESQALSSAFVCSSSRDVSSVLQT